MILYKWLGAGARCYTLYSINPILIDLMNRWLGAGMSCSGGETHVEDGKEVCKVAFTHNAVIVTVARRISGC